MKNRFFFTAGIAGMLSGVAFGATEGANKGWFSEYRPYVAVRGGWLFGKAEPGLSLSVPPNTLNMNTKKSLKSAWAGSVEFGTSHFDDRVFCGVEFGYFTGEFKLNEPLGDAGVKIGANGDIENFFAVGNIALRQDFGERAFSVVVSCDDTVKSKQSCLPLLMHIRNPLCGGGVFWGKRSRVLVCI